jgi:YfiH family protein
VSPALSRLGVIAGATTRGLGSMGGAATPAEAAERARASLAARLGFGGVVRVKQVHGDGVVRADAPFPSPWPEADAVWTDRPGVLLGVVAADCVPILIAHPRGWVGAAHAGWEGTTRRIAQRLVEAMRDAGADPAAMTATLGPSIGPCCYTVGSERARIVRERLGGEADRALVEKDGESVFDLWAANAEQLRASGVGVIEVAGTCTKCGEQEVFSRRGGDVGRLGLAFIGAYEGGRPPSDPPR